MGEGTLQRPEGRFDMRCGAPSITMTFGKESEEE